MVFIVKNVAVIFVVAVAIDSVVVIFNALHTNVVEVGIVVVEVIALDAGVVVIVFVVIVVVVVFVVAVIIAVVINIIYASSQNQS